MNPDQRRKLKITFPELADKLDQQDAIAVLMNLVEVKARQGDSGDQGEKGERGEPGTKGETGEQGPQGVQGLQGLRGERGITGKTGENGINGSPDSPTEIADKLNTLENILDVKVLRGQKEFFSGFEKRLGLIEKTNAPNPTGPIDQRWRGAGLSRVVTDSTLTGAGTASSPLHVVSSGGVTSVSNADGTLTISPTTGAVVASLNLSHANTWTGRQDFSIIGVTQIYSKGIGGSGGGDIQISGRLISTGDVYDITGFGTISANSFVGDGSSLTNIPISVSNADGSLTISPTTGLVVASLNVGHINNYTVRQEFADGTVSLPGIGFTSDTATGFYRTATGVTSYSSNGVKLVQFDNSTTTTGFGADAHVTISTNDTTAGANIKGAFNITNLGRNIINIIPRPNLTPPLIDILLTNSTENYIRILGPGFGNIQRLDFYTNETWFNGGISSTTNFTGAFVMKHLDDATTINNQFASARMDFQASTWDGSGNEYTDFYVQSKPYQGQSSKYYFSIQARNLGGYTGDSFVVQSKNWRTQTFSDNVGIGISDPAAHLDIFEDSASRIMVQLKGASSQSGDYFKILNSSNGTVFNIPSTGNIANYKTVATAGWGVPAVYAAGRSTAQTAAVASVATYTVGAADGSFDISMNLLVTTSTLFNFTCECAYTDEGNTARTITLSFCNLAGAFVTAIANAAGAVPYEGVPLHIRCKASTSITLRTQAAGTYTTVTFNVEGIIKQTA